MTDSGPPRGALAARLRRLRRLLARLAHRPRTAGDGGLWPRVDAAFAEVLALSETERGPWLDRLAARDPALRDEVASLLAAHRRTSVLDESLLDAIVAAGSAAAAEANWEDGATVAQYRLERPSGSGGMGIVYRAWDERLARRVALKFLTSLGPGDSEVRQRLFSEAQAAGRLDHPNICTIYEVGETADRRAFIAMPYYEGETLRQRIERGPLPLGDAVRLALQTARGLAKAHEQGILHRDIKPANLMVTADGVLKILDFGIASLTGGAAATGDSIPGTTGYMSPEQTRGAALDARSDIWSLGVVLYEMLAGVRPFRGADARSVRTAICEEEPAPLSVRRGDVPPALERLVRASLAKRAADRPASANDVAGELAAIALLVGAPLLDAAAPRGGSRRAGAPARPDGEERQVSLVVLRYSAAGERGEGHGPEEAARSPGRLAAEVDRAAARHGAVAIHSADGALLLFGAAGAQEDDCLRAVRAAAELLRNHSALEVAHGDAAPPRLHLHAGVGAGRVVLRTSGEAGSPLHAEGPALELAARLAALAPPQCVWLDAECRRLVEPFVRLAPCGSFTLAGEEKRRTAYEVVGESGELSRLEAALHRGTLTPYTGREHELSLVRACLEEACAGRGRFVTVTGDAGMGKSRLLQELHPLLEERQVAVLEGRCPPHGAGNAYLPFVSVLRDALEVPPGRFEDHQAAAAVARLHRSMPELDDFVPVCLQLLSIPAAGARIPRHLHGERFPMVAQEAIAAVLVALSRRRPLALLLEDWHWADDASRAVLRQLAELVGEHALLIVATCRPRYLVDWGVAQPHASIALDPLGPESTSRLVRAVLGAERVPAALSELLHERTGGNPFFLEEICHALVEEEALRVANGTVEIAGAVGALSLPGTVQAVIRSQLDRLDPAAHEALLVAAVAGREFERDVLEGALDAGADLPAVLQALKAAGLVQQISVAPTASYRFRHVLMQEVAYASLLEDRRRALHGRVGRALEAFVAAPSDEQLAALAHHFSQAECWERAVHYGTLAADRATGLAEFSEAMELLEQARGWLARLPDGPDRRTRAVDILLRQERLGETLGLRERQQRIIDEVMTLLRPDGDRAQLAEASLRQGDLCTLLRRFEEADQALERSLRLWRELDDVPGVRHVLRSLGLLHWHQGHDEAALALIEEALALDREHGDEKAMVGDLSNLGYVLKGLRRFDAAREWLQEALSLSDRLYAESSDPSERNMIAMKRHYLVHNLANVYRELGETDRALELMRLATQRSEGQRLPIQLSYHYTSIAHLCLQSGRVEESLEHYRMAVDLTRRAAFVPGLSFALGMLGEVLAALHRFTEALPLLEEAARLFAQLAQRDREASLYAMIARVHEELGGDAEALAAWGRARTLRRQIHDQAGEMAALEGLARTTRRLVPEPSLAVQHYREAAALAAALADRRTEGRLRNVIGILEWEQQHWEAALSQYEAALDAFERCDDPEGVGLALNSIGVTLRAQGRADDARAVLQRAMAHNEREARDRLLGHTLAQLGELDLEAGRAEPAVAALERSLAIRTALDDRRGAGWMRCALARAAVAGARPERARELLAGATAAARECGDAALGEACERLLRSAGL